MDINEQHIKSYLKGLLEDCSKHELTPQENAFIMSRGVENFIYDCVVSPVFKKWNIPRGSEQKIKEAIRLNVSSSQPIHFVLPFGGFKLWHSPVYCEVSWCEFFSLSFYTSYLAPILAAYVPGVVFSFITDDMIINCLGEVPKADVEKYFHSFNELLSSFARFYPSNLKFNLHKEEPTSSAPTSSANINEWYSYLTRRRGENKILVSCTPIPEAISLGSTPNSITMFWSGMGVIEKRPEGPVNRIVSRGIWDEIAPLPHAEIESRLLDLHNLNKILIFPEKFGVGKYRHQEANHLP